jgi:hypothetical protein
MPDPPGDKPFVAAVSVCLLLRLGLLQDICFQSVCLASEKVNKIVYNIAITLSMHATSTSLCMLTLPCNIRVEQMQCLCCSTCKAPLEGYRLSAFMALAEQLDSTSCATSLHACSCGFHAHEAHNLSPSRDRSDVAGILLHLPVVLLECCC